MAVTPERRAQQAAASARYRARQKAIRQGTAIPDAAVRRVANPQPVAPVVVRAFNQAARSRQRRTDTLEGLPSVRNPETTIYVPRVPLRKPAQRSTAGGQARQAAAIRERAAAERLQTLGRARKFQLEYELIGGSVADRLQEAMNRTQQARFQAASREIAGIPQQALAILFLYEGGQGDYSSALERILSSPGSRDVEEGIDKLEALADLAVKAGELYAPRAIGRLSV